MKDQLLAMEHYRLHVIEEWKEGPQKSAALAAIRSALAGLELRNPSPTYVSCSVCQSRMKRSYETQEFLNQTYGRAA